MQKTIFAVAAVVLLLVTSCKKENFESCSLSITEVTEHRIAGQCIYTPNDNENGYMLFLTFTDNLTDKMRNQMLESYHEKGAIGKSVSFACDSLVTGETYYVMAVAISEKNGKAAISSVTSLKQATLANNDSRVTITNKSMAGVTFNVKVAEQGYSVSRIKVDIDGVYSYNYSASVDFAVLSDSDETKGNNCYSNGNLVCPFSFIGLQNSSMDTCCFYGTDQDCKKYKATIVMTKWDIENNSTNPEFHIYN